jgi:hypothetical protein
MSLYSGNAEETAVSPLPWFQVYLFPWFQAFHFAADRQQLGRKWVGTSSFSVVVGI